MKSIRATGGSYITIRRTSHTRRITNSLSYSALALTTYILSPALSPSLLIFHARPITIRCRSLHAYHPALYDAVGKLVGREQAEAK